MLARSLWNSCKAQKSRAFKFRLTWLLVAVTATIVPAFLWAQSQPAPRPPAGKKAGTASADKSGKKDQPKAGATDSADSAGTDATSPAGEADPKRTGKSLIPPAPAGKGKAKALETQAQQCKTGPEALELYTIFLANPDTSAEDKKAAEQRLEFWQQVAKDDLVRVGKKWIDRAEAQRLEAEADKLVEEAIEMINVKNYKKADEKLQKASNVYPDHLDSLFLLGFGAFLTDDIKGAEKRFTQCLSRSPNNVSVLNNVAVCEALTKEFASAVRHWEQASILAPENEHVVQNLGRFIADANDSQNAPKPTKSTKSSKGKAKAKDFGKVDQRTIDAASVLYSKLLSGGKVKRSDPSQGYVVMGLGKGKKKEDSDSPTGDPQIVGNGSGFVIANGYVLTNRHVVENADGIVIQDPANPKADLLGGKVIAVAKDLDLALIQCDGLSAPAVPINAGAVGRGTEVLALGFPVMDVVGKGLKATRGIITGVPTKDTGNLMVLDVQINPGNSGGPLCDRSGRVMGIVAAKTFTERFVQSYGLAIPMADALPFITKNVPGYASKPAEDKPLEWTEVDSRISPSTVLILIKKAKPKK